MNCGENNKFHLNLIADVRHFRALFPSFRMSDPHSKGHSAGGGGWDHTGTITSTITTPSSPAVVDTLSAGTAMHRGAEPLPLSHEGPGQ